MIVADTSALISLALAETLDRFFDEFDVHTTETVVCELEETASHDDRHANVAASVLSNCDRLVVHRMTGDDRVSSRVDRGEGSCAQLANDRDAEFLITDDLRALPELQAMVDAQVAISPIVINALVNRGVLEPEDAEDRVARLAKARDWLGAPIYRRARALFEEE